MNIDMMGEAKLAMQQDTAQEMIRRKLEIDALRERLTPGQDPKEKLREACQGFESIFIQKMWDQMRKNVPKEGYLHSKQEEMYQSLYDQEFSKKMTEAGGIGLADMLYEQLSQTMAHSSRTTSPGVNPRLPIVPATSSPGNIKFSQPDQAYNSQIKPLYEEYDEKAILEQEKFTLPGRGEQRGLPLPGRGPAQGGADLLTVDDIDFEAESHDLLRQEMEAGREAAREADRLLGQPQPEPVASLLEPGQSWSSPPVSLQASTGAGLRSSARRQVSARGGENVEVAAAGAPSAGSIPHPLPGSHGPGGLSPEQQRILAAALNENLAAISES